MDLRFINFFNLRTLLVVAISQIAVFLAIQFQIKFNINVMLFGLAVVFPLHFSIQSAYQRRERAIQYFSKFKAAMVSLYNSMQVAPDLTVEIKTEGRDLLQDIAEQFTTKLTNREPGYQPVLQNLNRITIFISTHKKDLSNRNAIRMITFLNIATESSIYLVQIISHRTMAGLRFFAIFFVMVFPFVQAPILLDRLDGLLPHWLLHLIVGLTSIVLVSLSNFQKMIEYPFDQAGLDNIQLKEFEPGIQTL